MKPEPVHLTASHVAAGHQLSSLAGWNQTPEDWHMLLELSGHCYGLQIDGQLVSTATLFCYGDTLGWVGMVLTHPDFRRQGFARLMMNRVMERAQILGIRTVKLDATDDGRHLYESLGFQMEQPIERWERRPQPGNYGGLSTAAVLPRPLDTESCSYNRRDLLTHLVERGNAVMGHDGYVLDRPGRLNRYLGPCVAKSQSVAQSLIGSAISRSPGIGWCWDLLPANAGAVALARDFGFERARTLTRMTLGHELRGREQQIFANAGFDLG